MLAELANENPLISAWELDVTDQASVDALAAHLGDKTVNVLVANAGGAFDGTTVADADVGRLYSVVEALLASNRAMQDSHQSSLQTLQQSLISNQRLLQEALAASQRQVASVQTHNFALIVAAGCLGVGALYRLGTRLHPTRVA
jgi:NAD(P)-dependent dehydrogenase (short-subunit alcohol dehydrogenase family)